MLSAYFESSTPILFNTGFASSFSSAWPESNRNAPFNDNITQINDLLSFRKNIYSTLQDILVDDPGNNNDVSLFRKLKTLNTDYSKTCVTNLTKLKDTLETYTCYRNLTQDTKEVAKNTIEVIDNIINRIKSEEIEY